jgi:hypothetical protein
MLVYAPFTLRFVTLRGVFMRFPELTYWRDAIVSVPCFLLFLCFRKVTQEIFSELDETKPEPPIFPGHKTKTEEEPKGGQGAATPRAGTPPLLAAPGGGVGPLVHLWRCLSAYIKPTDSETLNQSVFFEKEFCSTAAVEDEFLGADISVLAPYRDGEVAPEPSPSMPSPPSPSPSTSPLSPSTLLSHMMRRE